MSLSFYQKSIAGALIMVGLLINLTSCTGVSPTNSEALSIENPSSFRLHILEDTYDSLGLNYQYEPTWETLQQVYTSTTGFDIHIDDIEVYNWTDQTMALTTQATEALASSLGTVEGDSASALMMRAFVVTLDDKPIYGGIFFFDYSAMAIHFPVIYSELVNNQLILKLRPTHSITGTYTSLEPDWHGIKDERIREIFRQAGNLKE